MEPFARWILSDDPQPYNSYGNGSAMRVSPVGWLFDGHQKVLTQAQLSALPSHNHMGGVFGAQCVAGLIYKLRTGEIDKDGIKTYIAGYEYQVNSVKSIRMHNSFNETCHVTVPQAISCFLEANDFEETIRLAVSIGGDSDTIAAIAGSIAESYYTTPEWMKDEAMNRLPSDMKMIVEQFYNHI